MKLLSIVRLGALLLIGLNLLMAFACIWIFTRMAPAIEVILEQNERSLEAGENMLAALVLASTKHTGTMPEPLVLFREALDEAQDNITEQAETGYLRTIERRYREAFTGNADARTDVLRAIRAFGAVNREAMERADRRARQLGNGGAWGVVFMATAVFLAGLVFLRTLKRNLVRPLEEIALVVDATLKGDTLRRCMVAGVSKDIKVVFSGLDLLLDRLHKRQGNDNNRQGLLAGSGCAWPG